MHPVHDVDALLLLAMALSSKRRPAELVEIMAAVDLIQGAIPPEAKLVEAFRRLATHGLLGEDAGRFSLSADAQAIIAGLTKKTEMAERVFEIRQRLASYNATAEHAPIVLTSAQLSDAIRTHRASAQGAGKNLLMPKPKTAEPEKKRAGHWRKPAGAARRRKA